MFSIVTPLYAAYRHARERRWVMHQRNRLLKSRGLPQPALPQHAASVSAQRGSIRDARPYGRTGMTASEEVAFAIRRERSAS